jgi:RimJ/RimL family protein N-acetyltransferase
MSTLETPRGPVVIRPTREEDAESYRELRLEAIRTNQTAFTTDYETNLARPREWWVELMRGSARGVIQVADASGTIVGMSGIYRSDTPKTDHNGIIWGVYVEPAWRGLGIVDALLSACCHWARAGGLPIVKLSAVATNLAIRAYLRNGFSIYGVEPDAVRWQGVSYDELLMYRRLEV